MKIVFAHATGFVEREMDRLAPQGRGRISRIDAKPGDVVKKGEALVWIDYAPDDESRGAAYLSADAARVANREVQLEQLRIRRDEVERMKAVTRGAVASARARVEGYGAELAALDRSGDTVRRLRASGAATEAEVARFNLRRAELIGVREAARLQANAEARALDALREETHQIADALEQIPAPPPPPTNTGVVVASRDGVVGWVPRHVGEVVGPNDAVVLILDRTQVKVRAYVSPRDAQNITPGRLARIDFPTGETLKGEVKQVHLLASLVPDQQPLPTANQPPAADPESSYLLADVSVLAVPQALADGLVVGSPVEVLVRRRIWNSLFGVH